VDPRPPEHLIGEHVSETRKDVLIHEQRFEAGAVAT
jgi:hypothetical protein